MKRTGPWMDFNDMNFVCTAVSITRVGEICSHDTGLTPIISVAGPQ